MIARSFAAALALALACVPRNPAPAPPIGGEPTVAATPEPPPLHPPTHAEPLANLSSRPSGPAGPPSAEQSVVPIDAGLGRDPWLGWPTESAIPGQSSVVLFASERAALRRAVGAELARRKIATIPIAELERIEQAAAEGTLVLENNQRCASPLSRDDVKARYFADLPEVTIDTWCWEECRLQVMIPKGDDSTYLTSRPVKHPEDPKRWIAATKQFTDMAYGMGGIGLAGVGGSVPPVRFGAPSWVGAWPKPPTEAELTALDGQASACAHPDPMVGLTYTMRAVVDARGRIGRCEGEGPLPWAREADAACICRVLGELRLSPGAGKRRLWVEATDDGGFAPNGGTVSVVQPGTDVWIDRIKSSLALERCAATHPLPAKVDAMVSLQLAPDGRVEDVRIDADLRDATAMQWAQCVVGELRTVALPCRPPGIEVLRTRLAFAAP